MDADTGSTPPVETPVTVRYWASARAAAGCAEEQIALPDGATLAQLTAIMAERHGAALERVIAVCSVLIDEQPVGTRAPGDVVVRPGASVEFLPPFAGG